MSAQEITSGEGGPAPIRLASFRIRDAYQPPPPELLLQLFGDRILQGRLSMISDNGQPGGGFAVLEVEACGRTVIVPLACVLEWCEG